jgi:hypothetical protein
LLEAFVNEIKRLRAENATLRARIEELETHADELRCPFNDGFVSRGGDESPPEWGLKYHLQTNHEAR